ncbi:MAG: hypothetical protein NTW19_01665, partial [Planctomycetota bacterium]|nr:hypothetical protein [Planctomycetota bacterium]
ASARPKAKELRTIALQVAKELAPLDYPVASAYAALITASVESLEGRAESAALKLRVAIAQFDALGMGAFLATSRIRLARLVGGAEGEGEQRLAGAWMAQEGVLYPEPFTEMMAPGFVSK